MPKTPRPKASLGVERVNVPGALARATIMHTAILAAVAMFASPPIAMAAFLLLIQAAATAQAATTSRTKGLASLRDTKVDALWTAMKTLKLYVQGLCDTVDAITATSMIDAAGLLVATHNAATKLLLAATYIPATGIVHLVVNKKLLIGQKTSKTVTFTWSWSTDGGKTWSPGITTGYAQCDVPGLPPASYQFRVFATVGKTPGEPTPPFPLTIH